MTEHKGKIITFYSFKGGMGRSMALANVAALLSRWGMRVLVIDWDLEAPGIECFFESVSKGIRSERKRQSGVVEMIGSFQSTGSLQWREAIMHVQIRPDSEPIDIMTAGRSDGSYIRRLQAIDWENLFSEGGLGNYLDEIRREWLDEYDYVLIDSRTGISDIGGITTILFPDILVLFFTTTNQSVDGVNDVMKRALKSQSRLPFDRTRLIGIPVPARDESHSERKLAQGWYKTFAKELGWIYKEWLPSNVTPRAVIDKIRIPYVPRWSFFEGIPVLEEGTDAPESIGAAYERLAKLLFFDCNWEEVERGPHPTDTTEVLMRLSQRDRGEYSLRFALAKEEEANKNIKIGNHSDAVTPLMDAVNIYREFSKISEIANRNLARSLSNLAVVLSEIGNYQEALTTVREATEIHRQLVH